MMSNNQDVQPQRYNLQSAICNLQLHKRETTAMEIKFTPWRMAYIKSADAPAGSGCVLCDKGRAADDAADLVLFRGASCYVIMNLYPYNTGHLMVTPYTHIADLPGLEAAT